MIKSPTMRIGMYGGAFDPPHLAHVALAKSAIAQLNLNVLHIVPTGGAWHKTRALSSAAHRLTMTRLAFEGIASTLVDDCETMNEGPSYTWNSLQLLQKRYANAQLFLLMGTDQLAAFGTWYRCMDITQIATLSVAARSGAILQNPVFSVQNASAEPVTIEPVQITMPQMPMSSSDVRSKIHRHESIGHLVKPAVASYIATHHLYQNI